MLKAYRPESFLTMFRKDSITPYTSFASSSNASPVLVKCGCPLGVALRDTADCSPTATTTPVADSKVFRGLLTVFAKLESALGSGGL